MLFQIKACLGMQVVTFVATVMTFLITNIIRPHIMFTMNCDEETTYKRMCISFHVSKPITFIITAIACYRFLFFMLD